MTDQELIIEVLRGLVVEHAHRSGVLSRNGVLAMFTAESSKRFGTAVDAFVKRFGMHGEFRSDEPTQQLKILGAVLSPDSTGGALVARTPAGKVRIGYPNDQFSSSWWPKEDAGPVLLTESCDNLESCVELTDTVLRNILGVGEDLGFEKLDYYARRWQEEDRDRNPESDCHCLPPVSEMAKHVKGIDEQYSYSILALTVDKKAHRWAFNRRVDLEDRWQTMVEINAFRSGDNAYRHDSGPHRTIPMSFTWSELVKIFRGGTVMADGIDGSWAKP